MILAAKPVHLAIKTGLYRASFLFALGLLVALTAGCDRRPEVLKISGATMGTSYHITVVAEQRSPEDIEQQIAALLDQVDQSMSTYKPDSELNRLNRAPVDQPFSVSSELMAVLGVSKRVWEESGGAFDPTVGPLVDLWGFGPVDTNDQIPSAEQINEALMGVGFDKLEIVDDSNVQKLSPVRLDLSAVAKGYAVDLVANWLESRTLKRYLVEVGGELRASGLNPDGRPWRLAIEQPELNSGVAQIMEVEAGGIATSGDYRNYFEKDGQRYSHEIDSRTGMPIKHNVASVTVIADNCASADAWATALLVMGQDGIDLANRLNLPVFMLVKTTEGFTPIQSDTFNRYLN